MVYLHEGGRVDERELVDRAKSGDTEAFGALVARYRRRAFGLFMVRLRDADEADELCQEAFIKAFLGIRGLRNSAVFGAWFFAVCRNCLRLRAQRLASARERELPLDEETAAAELADWEAFPALARAAMGLLDEQTREAVVLVCECGLSYAQAAAAAGITVELVKSRLFRARERLRRMRPELEAGLLSDPGRDRHLKEDIMKDVASIRRAAGLVERLSLKDQLDLARAADANSPFGERLLAELSAQESGKEWIREIGARLSMAEFIKALGRVDPFTEKRIVETLETKDPELAEKIKRNMFVFEDFILFDPAAMAALIRKADRKVLALALSGTTKIVLDHFLAVLDPKEAQALQAEVAAAVGDMAEIEEARYAMVQVAQAMDMSGEIRVCRPEEMGEGQVYVTAG